MTSLLLTPTSEYHVPSDRVSVMRRYIRLFALLIGTIGVLILGGWALDIALFRDLVAWTAAVMVNTRVAFGLAMLNIALCVVVAWWCTVSLDRAEGERRQATETVTRSEHRFRSLIEQSTDAIALLASDGRYTYQSTSAARVLGADEQQLVDTQFGTTIHPDDQPRARAEFLQLVASPGQRMTSEWRFKHGDGTWHWMEARMTNLLHDPNVGCIVSNYRDTTEEKKHEEATRAAELRFRQMADNIKEAFFVVDLDTDTPLYISPNWAATAGRPLAEGYDPKIWAGAIHPEDQERMMASLARVRAGEPTDDEYRIIRPDGSFKWVHGRAFPVRDDSGRVYRLVGLSADITELRQTQERFTQAQKMEAVGRLAGGVAHDFNNLLTVILGEAEMLRREFPAQSPNLEMLQNIEKAGGSAVALTRQLLAFSRKQLVEPTVFDVNDAVSDMTKMLGRLIGEDIKFGQKLGSGPLKIRADRGQFEQVLTNLAVNARDAMPKGGTISLETSIVQLDGEMTSDHSLLQSGEYVMLTVSDTGMGMSEEVRLKAFEPFFSTKPRGQGTGLGLSTCIGIVRQAGGDIAIYSEPGIGTTMRVYMPRVVSGTGEIVAVTVDDIPKGTERVLLVEDDSAVRRIVARMLKVLGYTVLEAGDGEEAKKLFAIHGAEINLLFTDVVLPGMSGREVAEWVIEHYPHVRVLFATGYTDDVILRHQLLKHHVSVLHKPYTRTELAQKLRAVFDGRLSVQMRAITTE